MKKILTLCIIHQGDRVLLGLKKRGFGEGKWNGFGGKVTQGETIEAAAGRELFEEVGITAVDMKKLGVLDFSWQGKPDDILQVHIFKAKEFTGEPRESEEMKPQWFSLAQIPFEKMWADDKHWLPLFLNDQQLTGRFVFDKNNNVFEYHID